MIVVALVMLKVKWDNAGRRLTHWEVKCLDSGLTKGTEPGLVCPASSPWASSLHPSPAAWQPQCLPKEASQSKSAKLLKLGNVQSPHPHRHARLQALHCSGLNEALPGQKSMCGPGSTWRHWARSEWLYFPTLRATKNKPWRQTDSSVKSQRASEGNRMMS